MKCCAVAPTSVTVEHSVFAEHIGRYVVIAVFEYIKKNIDIDDDSELEDDEVMFLI